MDCRSCGVVNAPGRRYCRECGTRLGQPCPVCHFFNAAEDKHCGGCGRRLKAGAGPLAAEVASSPVAAPAVAAGGELAALGGRIPPGPPPLPVLPISSVTSVTSADIGIGGQGVSQSEIDGLFENILDEEPDESVEGGA